MFQKLEAVEQRYEELTKKISDPDVIARTSEWTQYMKEHAEIEEVVLKYKEYKKVKNPRHLYDLLSEIWCADTCAPIMRAG